MKSDEATALLQQNPAVLKDHHVKALYLFGSVVRGEDKPGSDVDILVEFQPNARVGPFGVQAATAIIGNPWQARGPDDT